MADAPEEALLLWDAAAVHGGPGRSAHQAARSSVLLFSIDAALTAADATILTEDASPRPLRKRLLLISIPPFDVTLLLFAPASRLPHMEAM